MMNSTDQIYTQPSLSSKTTTHRIIQSRFPQGVVFCCLALLPLSSAFPHPHPHPQDDPSDCSYPDGDPSGGGNEYNGLYGYGDSGYAQVRHYFHFGAVWHCSYY